MIGIPYSISTTSVVSTDDHSITTTDGTSANACLCLGTLPHNIVCIHVPVSHLYGLTRAHTFAPTIVPRDSSLAQQKRDVGREAPVKKACTHCHKSGKKCSNARPCKRCVHLKLHEGCVDHERKPRRPRQVQGPTAATETYQSSSHPLTLERPAPFEAVGAAAAEVIANVNPYNLRNEVEASGTPMASTSSASSLQGPHYHSVPPNDLTSFQAPSNNYPFVDTTHYRGHRGAERKYARRAFPPLRFDPRY